MQTRLALRCRQLARSSSRAIALFLLVVALGAAGCDQPAVWLDVTVTGGLPPEARLLQVTAQLDGVLANQQTNPLLGAPSTFRVRMPGGTRGALQLLASALPDDGCALAEGKAVLQIDSDATYHV